MGTRGIVSVKADLTNYNSNRGIIELNQAQNTLTVLIDEECLGVGTVDKQATLRSVKWVLIKQLVWVNLLSEFSEDKKANQAFYDSIKGSESVTHVFEGNQVDIDIGSLENKITDGDVYLIMPFNNYPEYSADTCLRMVYISDPKVRYCYFEPKEIAEADQDDTFEHIFYYGDRLEVKGSLHLIPDFRMKDEVVEAVIDIVDQENKTTILESIPLDLSKFVNQHSYNVVFTITTAVKEEWRDKLQHKKNDIKGIVAILRFTFPGNSNKNIPEFDSLLNFSQWRLLDAEKNTWYDMPMCGMIRIPYEGFAEILQRQEIARNNQIAQVGDIAYSFREYNPCGYTRIGVKDKLNPERKEKIIFNEKETAIDDVTDRFFYVIRGDEPPANTAKSNNVEITVYELSTEKGCESVLLDPGQLHTDLRNVFNMGKIYSSKRLSHELIMNATASNGPPVIASANNYQRGNHQYEEVDLHTENYQGKDYNPVAVGEKKDGASVFRWVENKDYQVQKVGDAATFEIVNLKYRFNKTFDTQFSTSLVNDAIDLAWVFNYFLLSHDQKQTYFVPVSSCRYPNQLAMIRVYPNVKWEVNVFWNTKDPVWYGTVDPTYDLYSVEGQDSRVKSSVALRDVRNTGDAGALSELIREERDRKRENQNSQREVATVFNRGLGNMMSEFGLSIKVNYNNVEHKLSWGGLKKIRGMLSVLKEVYDLVDGISGAKDARRAKGELQVAAPAMIGRLNAMSLQLKAPAPSIGLSWGFKTTDDSVALELKGKVKCSPLIGGDLKIDLLALANKIPVYGQLITALDIGTWVLERLSLGSLEIDYRIDLIFYADLALEEAFISYLNKADGRSEWDADLSVSGTFGGKLELSLDVKAKVVTDVEIYLDGGIEADCSFKVSLDIDARLSDIITIKTEFSGLIVMVKFNMGVRRKNETSRSKSKKIDPIRLIPSSSHVQTLFNSKEN